MIIRLFTVVLAVQIGSCRAKGGNQVDEADGSEVSSTVSSESANLLAPNNPRVEIHSFSLVASPEIKWDSVVGADLYEVAIGTQSGGVDILDWTNVGNVTVYKANDLNLIPSTTYFASIRAVDSNGLVGPTATANGWEVLPCPAGYIPVPGNPTAGLGGVVYSQGTKSNYNWFAATETIRTTADFCVMKYEAKDAGNHIAESTPISQPWVSIQREQAGDDNDAQEACENNGEGFQLIGNHHWQAIARDIESVDANFDRSGLEEDFRFNRGHADSGPNLSLEADSDDANGCIGVTSNGDPTDNCNGAWHINKRTHALSNGQLIWDFSGNVHEWVRDNIDAPQGQNGHVQGIGDPPEPPFTNTLQWGPIGDYSLQTGSSKAGLGYGTFSASAGAVLRGGGWASSVNAGLFAAGLSNNSNHSTVALGFRCIFAP